MRKLIYSLILCSTLALSSCFESNSYDDGGYTDVYNGLVLIQSAVVTNGCTVDGVSVATRLAILLREMENVGLEFTVGGGLELAGVAQDGYSAIGTYTLSESTVNKKELLFGDNDDSTIVLNADGTYSITYGTVNEGYYTCGYLDSIYRYGTYTINTNGKSFWESSSSNPWTVTHGDSTMKYSMIYDDTSIYITVNDQNYSDDDRFTINVYNQDNLGTFGFKATNFRGGITSYTTNADWECEGTFKFGNVTSAAGLTVSNTMAYSTTYDLTGSGLTLYNYYSVYTTPDKLVYRPTSMYLTPASGTEKITNEQKEDVYTTRTFSTIGFVVAYDGYSYTATYTY
ncbi:MAG: hypothetical protein SNH28_07250 [Rikenellaceae bacterium]